MIETSGLADPSPILQTFSTDRALGEEFHVEALIAVVDAAAGENTLEWSAEARKQVILADRLIVTKTDLADAAALVAKLGDTQSARPGRDGSKRRNRSKASHRTERGGRERVCRGSQP